MMPLFVDGSEGFTTKALHESFHAYQGNQTPERLLDSENANLIFEGRYPFDDPAQVSGWEDEVDLLAKALEADSDKETIQLVGQFLTVRQTRREPLPPDMVNYEQQRDWLEGMAKYAEMEIWRQGYLTNNYIPLPEMSVVFSSHSTFQTA